MKRRKAVELEPLSAGSAAWMRAASTSFYGLEPVYEPGTGPSGRLLPEEFVAVDVLIAAKGSKHAST